jgi:2-phosphoglycerate kinase
VNVAGRRLYLVGGSAGAGKTTTCRLLAHELEAGWLQIDTVWLALEDAFPPGSDEHTLLSIDERIRKQQGSVEDLVEQQVRAAAFVCKALRRALMFELEAHRTVVADGAWLLPAYMAGLELENTAVAGAILHEPDRDEVKAAMASRRTKARMVAPWHDLSATVSWQFGNRMAQEAAPLGIPVVAARPRDTLVSRLKLALALTD